MAMTGGTAVLVKSEYANYGNSNWLIKLYVYYKTSQDSANNQSTITVGMYVETPSGYDIGSWTDYNGSYIGTSSLTFNGTIPNFSGVRWLAENKTFTVNHNSDGTGTATIYWKWGVNSPWGRYQNPSGSFQITLPTIPRASSITSAGNVTLGNTCSIKWTPASSAFKYKLKFVLGSYDSGWTGFISPNQTSQYTYSNTTIPLSVANKLPSSTTGTMTAYLATYNSSGTQIGSTASKTFTVTVPSTVIPTISSVSATIDNSGSTMAMTTIRGWGVAVAGYTKVKVTASASGAYSSTISSYTISGSYSTTQNGSSLSYTGSAISSSGTKTFTVKAKDSRNRESSTQNANSITFYSYSKPKITSMVATRNGSDGTKIDVKANWSYSTVNGNNSTTVKLYYKKSTSSNWLSYSGTITRNSNATITIPSGFDETSSYNIKVIVTDSLGNTSEETAFISTISVLMDFRAGGKGLGIGKIAETDSLEVDLPAKFYKSFYAPNFIQKGIAHTTPVTNEPTLTHITFANEFPGTPVVVATPITTVPGTTVTGVGVSNINSEGFDLYITRTNATTTDVCWIAVYI